MRCKLFLSFYLTFPNKHINNNVKTSGYKIDKTRTKWCYNVKRAICFEAVKTLMTFVICGGPTSTYCQLLCRGIYTRQLPLPCYHGWQNQTGVEGIYELLHVCVVQRLDISYMKTRYKDPCVNINTITYICSVWETLLVFMYFKYFVPADNLFHLLYRVI